ncbi:MAG: hypothetical protein ACT4R6_14285 [Gemmatimonadaceae bacterium]
MSRTMRARFRASAVIEWTAAAAVAVVLGAGAGKLLRDRSQAPAPLEDAAGTLVAALGAPSGVLLVVNPTNCTLNSQDAAALNALAALGGMRVTVLLLTIPQRDSILHQIRGDFGLSAAVTVASASTVNPLRFPPLLRQPFVAVLARGRLKHVAWGDALKALSAWLPTLIQPALHNREQTL